MSQPVLQEARQLPEERALLLVWSDGFTAKPSYRYLCGYCPCAGCQGHGGKVVYHEPTADVVPGAITPVGNYAISIAWQGGCHDGIYSYQFLRRICSLGGEDPAP